MTKFAEKIKLDLKKISARTDIWREGEYLDLWSVPHFLFGSLYAALVWLLHLDIYIAFLFAFVSFTLYEVFEYYIEIYETWWNRRLDIVVGMASFIPTTLFLDGKSFEFVFIFGLLVGIPDGYLSLLGWKASQKGHIFEEKVKREYEILKIKFSQRIKKYKEKKAEKRAAKLALKELKKRKKMGLL